MSTKKQKPTPAAPSPEIQDPEIRDLEISMQGHPVIDRTVNFLWEHLTVADLKEIGKTSPAKERRHYASIVSRLAQEVQKAKATDPGDQSERTETGDKDYRPELDPERPEFDVQQWAAAVEKESVYSEITVKLQNRYFSGSEKEIAATGTAYNGALAAYLSGLYALGREMTEVTSGFFDDRSEKPLSAVSEFSNSTAFTKFTKLLIEYGNGIAEFRDSLQAIEEAAAGPLSLVPYLLLAVEEENAEGKDKGPTIKKVLRHGFDENGKPKDGEYKKLIERAQELKKQFENDEKKEELPKLTAAKKASGQILGLDKVTQAIFTDGGTLSTVGGQIVPKKGIDPILCRLAFGNNDPSVTLPKDLTAFDERVFMAVSTIYEEIKELPGQKITGFSTTQIYRQMGYTGGRPKSDDLQKINSSLTKMGSARVYIDPSKAAKKWSGGEEKHIIIDDNLLSFARGSAIVNGQITESAIFLKNEPVLLTWQKRWGQITTIPQEVLESPINKTDANLQLENYLLQEIARMLRPSADRRRLLYSTVYEKCKRTTAKQKQRAKDTITRYLSHYKKTGWIADFRIIEDGSKKQIGFEIEPPKGNAKQSSGTKTGTRSRSRHG